MTRALSLTVCAVAVTFAVGTRAIDARSTPPAQQAPPTQQAPPAQQTPPAKPTLSKDATPADAAFIQKAWQAGKAEVELLEQARAHAQSDAVEAFARKVETDLRDANAALHVLADRLDVDLPERTPEQVATEARLEALRGEAFDREFVSQMIKDHEAAIALFESAAKSATDITVRTFAESKVPVLKDHLKRAQALKTTAPGR